jgi:hypothetical protein
MSYVLSIVFLTGTTSYQPFASNEECISHLVKSIDNNDYLKMRSAKCINLKYIEDF